MNCYLCGGHLEPGVRDWRIDLPLEPPSQNAIAQNKGAKRHAYRRLRDDFETLLRYAKVNLCIPTATKRRRVFITRRYSGRGQKRDRGNLVGGCKPLLDAMTRTGLIVDDCPEYLEDHYAQERADESGVVIVVEELCR